MAEVENGAVRRPRRRAWGLLALGLPMAVYLAIAVRSAASGANVLAGDGYYYASTAISLWEDHDLDLGNQLPGRAADHSGDVALDRHGRLVPKHPVVLPLVSLPVLAVHFGPVGCGAVNLLVLAVLLIATWSLAGRVATAWAAATATAVTGLGSFLPHYVWNYSGDLLGAALLLGAAALLASAGDATGARHAVAGLLVGAAVVSKPLLLVTLPAVAFFLWRRPRRMLVAFALGSSIPLLAYGALNTHLFGRPWVTAYDRMAIAGPDGWTTRSHQGDFAEPLWGGLVRQIADPRLGLARTSPVTIASLLFLPLLWRRDRALGWWCVWTAASLLVTLGRYRYWDVSEYGNRFLVPLVALAAVPLAAGLELLWNLAARRGR